VVRFRTTEDGHYVRMFGELARGAREGNDPALAASASIVPGLRPEGNLAPGILSEEGLRRIPGWIFDALSPPPS
jgi:hypothetical protein